jgi:multicomponent Na+:H+ antiporter subunit C
MELLLSCVVGGLVAASVYMLLSRSLLHLAVGLGLLAHGTNLLVFVVGGLVRDRPPIAPNGGWVADPLPQALILTAIVINFAVTAFLLVLARRACQAAGTDDLEQMRSWDR